RRRRECDGDLRRRKPRLRIEVRQAIESLRVRRLKFPAQTEVERQTSIDLPVVLYEERVIFALNGGLRREAQAARSRGAQQQRGDGVARLRRRLGRNALREAAREGEIARRIVGAVIVHAVDALVRPKLDRMRAAQKTQVLIETRDVLIIVIKAEITR